jgi:PAS domain S-box-containing protein
MSFKHLRTSLTLITSLLIILIFTSFGFITVNLNKELIRSSINSIHEGITEKVLIKLDSYLKIPNTINYLNDSLLRVNSRYVDELDILRKYFYKQLSIFKSVNLIAYGTEKGNYVEAQRLEDGRIRTGNVNINNLELWTTDVKGEKVKQEIIISNYDPRKRPWYISSVEEKIPTWSDIYMFSSNNKPAISANQPFYSDNDILEGVITTSITLEGVSKFLYDLSIDDNGSILIMEPSELVIGTSENIPLINRDNRRMPAAQLENTIFSTVSRKFMLSIEDNYTNKTTNFSILIEGSRYIIKSTPYHGPQGLRWNVLVIIPEADYMSFMYRASTWGAISFMVYIIITLVSSFFIAAQTTRPIEKLSNLAFNISLENDQIKGLSIPLEITSRSDEIGTLAKAFSDMGNKLGMTFSDLNKSRQAYKELVENINSIIMRVKPDGTITYCNPYGLEFYGYTKNELVGSTVQDTVLKTDDPKEFGVLQKLFDKDKKYWNGLNRNITANGKEVWILWANTMIYDQENEPMEILSIGQDFTSRNTAQLKLNTSLEEKDILLKEVHHRVKNNLQIITSLINLQLSDMPDQDIQDILESLQSRIQSMSLVHEMLYSRDSFTQIDFHDYVEQIISNISATYNQQGNPVKVTISGNNLYLDIERTTTCGLLVNEIIINAFKHAFINQKDCKIDVHIDKSDSGKIMVIIQDNGVGVSSLNINEKKHGMGTLLINALADQISGKIEISKNNGTSVKLTFPA